MERKYPRLHRHVRNSEFGHHFDIVHSGLEPTRLVNGQSGGFLPLPARIGGCLQLVERVGMAPNGGADLIARKLLRVNGYFKPFDQGEVYTAVIPRLEVQLETGDLSVFGNVLESSVQEV